MLKLGTILKDRYLILGHLGQGVSAYTYLAEDITRKERCAIKELRPDPKADYDEIRKRFMEEANYLGRLDGFNGQIPKLRETFPGKDEQGLERQYIVQDYIDGITLDQLVADMKQRGWICSESQVRDILRGLLPVVAHIHEQDFIHRDIKPSNIILRIPDRTPVLIDFGIVKEYETTFVRSGGPLTGFAGTPGYYDEDQEQMRPSVQSDLYALGAVAVYLLSQKQPSSIAKSAGKLLWADHVLGLSQDFYRIIDKALEPRTTYPGQRFGSAQAMLDALNHMVTDHELDEELTELQQRRNRPFERKHLVNCQECDWFQSVEETNCVNCGTYNVFRFTEDERYLLNHQPSEYLKFLRAAYKPIENQRRLIKLTQDEYNLLGTSTAVYINQHTDFLKEKLPEYLLWEGHVSNDHHPKRPDLDTALKSISEKQPIAIGLGEYLDSNRQGVGEFAIGVWIVGGSILGFFSLLAVLAENKLWPCFSPCGGISLFFVAIWTTRSNIWRMLDSVILRLLIDKRDAGQRLLEFYERKKEEKKSLTTKLLIVRRHIKNSYNGSLKRIRRAIELRVFF